MNDRKNSDALGDVSEPDAASLAMCDKQRQSSGVSRSGRRRLDQAMVEQGLCESREKAKRAILAGQARVNQQVARKPSDSVKPADVVTLDAVDRYVSRGGHKLEGALRSFQFSVEGMTAVDIGASTGGFTDCLLQHGAARIYAVDVGVGQLAWKLRQDPRVVVMEKVNARALHPGSFPPPFKAADLVAIDCSFISLRLLLPAAKNVLRVHGTILALIKPQFEAGKREVDRGRGVIRDPEIHRRVIEELETFVREQGNLLWGGVVESPLLGPAGNKEFLVKIEKTGA
jgi:23S rRNA (cytidine1920-2'-O)/16S rRNA (cytidine1409-2'-O)-methyltransferase